ncbi:glycoside hydrolase family 75 protein [Streptomyces sp. NPDC018693]|uniref:glycoside hydrolase family 75 protein n=1 Tax=unclassified Streptomyces TaxID=2593676 RepID=UPI00379E97B4
MCAPSLTLAAAGLALLAATSPPAPQVSPAAHEPVPPQEGSVSAADLLARVRDCVPVSRGRYRTDAGTPATVPVCGTRDAVFWKADLDIDCDGRPTKRCNGRTDPYFSSSTAFEQSDGRYLSAEQLPYIVVPAASRLWDHHEHRVRGGSVAALIYRDRVRYAVVGDTGPRDVIGEASYAAAKSLGIRPDPHGGGAPSGVTYIVFRNTQVKPIEDHEAAVATGERLARLFVRTEDIAPSTPTAAPTARRAWTGAAGRPGNRDAPAGFVGRADAGDKRTGAVGRKETVGRLKVLEGQGEMVGRSKVRERRVVETGQSKGPVGQGETVGRLKVPVGQGEMVGRLKVLEGQGEMVGRSKVRERRVVETGPSKGREGRSDVR